MSALLRFIAGAGLALGIFGALASVWAFFDPAGMPLANDADPFGKPPDRIDSVYAFAFSLAIAVLSAHRLRRHDDDGPDSDPSDDEGPTR
jgi:hypothetical protein